MAREEERLRGGENGGERGPDGSEEDVKRKRVAERTAHGEDGQRPREKREDPGELEGPREKRQKSARRPGREGLTERAEQGAAADADQYGEEDPVGRRHGS